MALMKRDENTLRGFVNVVLKKMETIKWTEMKTNKKVLKLVKEKRKPS